MIGYDDAFGEQVMGDAPIGGDRAEAWALSDWELRINDVAVTQLVFGRLTGSATLGQPARLSFTLRGIQGDQVLVPEIGARVDLVWQDALQLSGLVEDRRLRVDVEYGGAVHYLEVEAGGWEAIPGRRIIDVNFVNLNTSAIFNILMVNYLEAEDLRCGLIDDGVALILVEGERVRIHDLLRDVAEASGGIYLITPDKAVEFRRTTVLTGRQVMHDSIAVGSIDYSITREDYRNKQTVDCEGNGATPTLQTAVRTDDAEIAARQAVEGGTGLYEEFVKIKHPTSNDPTDVFLYADSTAILNLRTFGQYRRSFTAETLKPGFRLGEIIDVSLAAATLSGTWQIAGISFSAMEHLLKCSIEAVQTSPLQRGYKAWLKIIGQAKANIQVASALTSNVATYDTPGTYSFTVPAGVDLLEILTKGAGGGCGGNDVFGSTISGPSFMRGGNGGTGGKAGVIIDVVPGTSVTVIVGTGGSGGANGSSNGALFYTVTPTAGTSGTQSACWYSGLEVARGDPGSGGQHAYIDGVNIWPGAAGTNGGGSAPGGAVTVGGGSPGGVNDNYPYAFDGHVQPSGANGWIEIRW